MGLQLPVSDNQTGIHYTKTQHPLRSAGLLLSSQIMERGTPRNHISTGRVHTPLVSYMLPFNVSYHSSVSGYLCGVTRTVWSCVIFCAWLFATAKRRDHWMGKILRIMQAYLRRNCHVKLHKNAFMRATMARVKAKKVARGAEPCSGKGVIKPGKNRQDFQTLVRYCFYPSCDFTAEGTRQLQHELNCSLVPSWVPVCPFLSIFLLCYPSRQCRELTIFHSEGESIQWPHRYDTLMQMMDCS